MERSAAMPAASVKARRVSRDRVTVFTSRGIRALSRSQRGSQPRE